MSGVWVSALAGLGAGATAGGFLGALSGLGMNEHEAKIIEDELKEGNILIAIKPESDEQRKEIKSVLEQEDAYNIAA